MYGDQHLNESDYQKNNSGPNSPDDFSRLKGTVAKRNMATASFVCAVIALLTIQFFFISLPLGGTSVILALLSRGSTRAPGRARIAIIGGVIAMVLSCMITIYTIRQIYTNPSLRAQVEDLYHYYTGQIPGITGSTRESENEQPLSESPQEILQNILSGDYRENQAQQNGNSVSTDGISGNGGAYI